MVGKRGGRVDGLNFRFGKDCFGATTIDHQFLHLPAPLPSFF